MHVVLGHQTSTEAQEELRLKHWLWVLLIPQSACQEANPYTQQLIKVH